MPRIPKVSKEEILQAALKVVSQEGIECVNARRIAQELGCSTKPIFRLFINMEDLKSELKKIASQKYMEFVAKIMQDYALTGYQAYGIGFVRFAREEKNLFRYLYLHECKTPSATFKNENTASILKLIQDEYGFSPEIVAKLHLEMLIYSYGLATMINSGAIELSDRQIEEHLQNQFTALSSLYTTQGKKK